MMSKNEIDFGKTTADYALHRQGFPPEFFLRIFKKNYILEGQCCLDIGTGTGTLARGLALQKCSVTALDISSEMIAKAKSLDVQFGAQVQYKLGTAENLPLEDRMFDVVLAGQCWHWFDSQKALHEVKRVLKPKGRFIICYLDWLPLAGTPAQLSEHLMLETNSNWKMNGGNGFYPQWVQLLRNSSAFEIETESFDLVLEYSLESWLGRIRASAAISASYLTEDHIAEFNTEHARRIRRAFGKSLQVPHCVWYVTCKF